MKHFSITDDPIKDFERWDAIREEWLESRPICSKCGEHIQDEWCFSTWNDEELICQKCAEDIEDEDLQVYSICD